MYTDLQSVASPLGHSTVSLRADDGIRTRDPHLGKVMLYQLSHVRVPPLAGCLDDITGCLARCTNRARRALWETYSSVSVGSSTASSRARTPRGTHSEAGP